MPDKTRQPTKAGEDRLGQTVLSPQFKSYNKMKYGFDLHGVLDTYPHLVEMARLAYEAGHEVHIITGSVPDAQVMKQLEDLGVHFTHYFSITAYMIQEGHVITWDEKGMPHGIPEVWNQVKQIYCRKVGIDVIFDDSKVYQETFKDHPTLFCLVDNPNRKIYNVRTEPHGTTH